jgi:[acyl-carrier-protein] S-malonyltransferase
MYIFPGQGSQYRGIGSDLYEEYEIVRSLYDRASEVIGYDLAKLSFDDPDDQIGLTRFTQPVLLTHEIACLEVFKHLTDDRFVPDATAGHSLGEYSALVAAGSLSFEDALRLVQKRGELMGEFGEGEMLAFPLPLETVKPLAERHYCGIGGCNLPDQTVVGGRNDDLDRIAEEVKERFPRKRAVRLKTEGAFHTYLMIEAAKHFRPVLDTAAIEAPTCHVLSNYTGDYHEPDPEYIRSGLFFQLFNPVRWIWSMQRAADKGVTTIVEFGGGIGAGETPDEKRPNLESIIKKAFRGYDHPPAYFPVINSRTARETAAEFRE